jgi:hypothetical protein
MNTVIVDANKKVKRPGSGRTKGSFSFVNITLADLKVHLNDAGNVPIRVSRKWAEELGFQNVTSAPVKDLTSEIEGRTPATQAAVVVRNLDEDE